MTTDRQKKSKTAQNQFFLRATCAVCVIFSLAAASRAKPPLHSRALSADVAEDTFILYQGPDFTQGSFSFTLKDYKPDKSYDVSKDVHDDIRSLRWNLRPGHVVVLYADSPNKGKQYVLWGSGEDPELDDNAFGDEIDSFAWSNTTEK